MKKIIKFKNLETVPYNIINSELPDPNGCCTDLREEIKVKNPTYLSDLISDIANDCVDIYTQTLLETCSKVSFIPYIEEAESTKPYTFENQLRLAEYFYYYELLNKNLNEVVHNALVSYMKGKTIILEGSEADINEAEKHFKEYIRTTIKNTIPDTIAPTSSIIEKFEANLSEHIQNYTYSNSKLAVSYADAEDDTITALLLVPEQEPKVISIPVAEQLEEMQKLVGGLVEYLPLYSERTDGLMIDLICNEEGKLNSLPQNRCVTVADVSGKPSKEVFDIIYGSALIMAANNEGEQVDLPPEEIKKWSDVFEHPVPTFIGSMVLEDESFEVPDFTIINTRIVDISKQRDDDNER